MSILALDLEQTLIDDIWQGNLIPANIFKIKKIIRELKPMKIITFSWALIESSDFQIWGKVQNELADMGLIVETQQFNVRQLQSLFLKEKFSLHKLPHENSNMFLSEFATICQKELVFEWWAIKQPESILTLVDDMVCDKTVILKPLNKTINFIKI